MLRPHLRSVTTDGLNAPITFAAPLSVPSTRRGAASLSLHHFAPKTKNRRVPRSNVAAPDEHRPNRVAIIGGGLAGMATAYHLLNSTARYAKKRAFSHTDLRLTIFDPAEPGSGGASAAAAGLLHPFTPRMKKRVWAPLKSINATVHLVEQAQSCSQQPLIAYPGILRLALHEKQHNDFRIAAHRFPDELELLQPNQVADRFPHLIQNVSAIFLKKAAVVDTPAYLQALWRLCQQSERIEWRRQAVHDVRHILGNDTASFDTVVICAGAAIPTIEGLSHVPLRLCRGQNLLLKPREQSYAHETPVISGKYVVPDLFGHTPGQQIVAGATFEYDYQEDNPETFTQHLCKRDTDRALAELKQPLHDIAPGLIDKCTVHGTSSGTRALPPRSADGSIPIVCKLSGTDRNTSCWLFSGLGSRGVLHHAYLARMLAHAIVAGNERLIPVDARRLQLSLPLSEVERTVAACHG
ncbi:putative oxidoreductase YurR [Gracilariopsis chorda]|uniref:Putative oxidoreductase YurR n=1 Tax=Gracilariopsis chorda TaxID=448386 RepID=A0A2V3IQY7_9FLOR|nr:putative oxidoreductase YurR [Gracilariopsis chorda]|eukprot:PXF44504.1 putative oxidoreductase YurR [Gracilariopsis chorda]